MRDVRTLDTDNNLRDVRTLDTDNNLRDVRTEGQVDDNLRDTLTFTKDTPVNVKKTSLKFQLK